MENIRPGEFHETLSKVGMLKRYFERATADPAFREAFRNEPHAALSDAGIVLDSALVSGLLHGPGTGAPHPVLEDLDRAVREKAEWVRRFYWEETLPTDSRFLAWRERQIARQRLDLGSPLTDANLHAPFCFELSRGCSMGCWFCAFSPAKLEGVFSYHEANAALWKGILCRLQERFGPGVGAAFLYWATEPFDNPDYERFCADFCEITGIFPPTTTAAALKDPSRTRAFLRMSEEAGCWINRFSILTRRMMERVHAEFTADELALVECLSMNKESLFAFANAGSFRDAAQADPELLLRHKERLERAPGYRGGTAEEYPLGSNACVTGFLINMFDRSVRLISPCTADDDHPFGYVTHGEGSFDGAADLEALLDTMIEAHMPNAPGPLDLVRLPAWLRTIHHPNGFELAGRFGESVSARDDRYGPHLLQLEQCLRQDGMTRSEIMSSMEPMEDAVGAFIEGEIDRLFRSGAIELVEKAG